MIELFTIGYERRTVGELIDELRANGIDRVIDVRELPLSRRKGFSKTPLSAALADAGIDYVHLRAAGNPYRRDDDGRVLARYRTHLARSPAVLDAVVDAARGRRAALLCLERDAADCHRGVLAAAIAGRDPTVSVCHV